MPDELPVHVSRDELHELAVPSTFEAHSSFDVQLVNHGEPLHLHLHLDDALSEVAAIDASNHYVEGDSARVVRVHVDEGKLSTTPVRGKLKVASAYGAETRWIDVVLAEPDDDDDSVRVDESLSTPQPREEPADTGGILDRPELPVLGLGLVALTVALAAALVLGDTLILAGSLVVLGGVLLALFILLR